MARIPFTTKEERTEAERREAVDAVRRERDERLRDPALLMALFAPASDEEEAEARAFVRTLRDLPARAEAAETAAEARAVRVPRPPTMERP